MTTTANIQSNGNGAVQNINMMEEGTMKRENNNINMVTRSPNIVRMGSISKIIGTAVLGLALTVSLAMPGGARADVPVVSSTSSSLFDNLNDDFSMVFGTPDSGLVLGGVSPRVLVNVKTASIGGVWNDDFSLVFGTPDAPAKLKTASISGAYNDDFSLVFGTPDSPAKLKTASISGVYNDDFSLVFGTPDSAAKEFSSTVRGLDSMNDDGSLVYGVPDSIA